MADQKRVVLAIDYGLVRVGLARTDESGTLAVPLATVERTGDRKLAEQIARLVRELGATAVVVGLPLRDDDRETPVLEGARRFARQLGKKCGLTVGFVDESHSSADADARAALMGLGRKAAAKQRDSLAAAEILRRFLEEGAMAPEAAK